MSNAGGYRYIKACTSIAELQGVRLLMAHEGMAVLEAAAARQIRLLQGYSSNSTINVSPSPPPSLSALPSISPEPESEPEPEPVVTVVTAQVGSHSPSR